MYYTITKPSGLKLNVQKTDFNVEAHNFAKFFSKEDADKWIEENNHRFIAIESKKPIKLQVNKHK